MMHFKLPEIFYGWWIVVSCFITTLLMGGFVVLGFTAFFEPIRNEFSWSYAQVSLASSLRGIEAGIMSPVMGFLTDRWGPRRLMLAGILIVGCGLILLSQITSLGQFYACFVLVAFGSSGSSATVVTASIAYWFRRRLGLATGIMASGFALGGLLVPLVVKLIDAYQWRTAIFILGVTTWVIGLPLSLMLRHRPEQYGYQPDGETNSPISHKGNSLPVKNEISIGPLEAVKNRAFWHIGLAMLLHFFSISAVVIHVMPYLSSVGIPRSLASLVATAVPLLSIAGRLGSGWLGDRFNKKRVASVCFAMTGIGMLFFSYVSRDMIWLIIPFIVVFGIGWGGNPVMRSALIQQYFGNRSFGTIIGFIMGIMAVAGILAPFLAGWAYDNMRSYQVVWLAFAALSFIAVVVIETMPAAARQPE